MNVEYENYSETSKHYDSGRVATGGPEMLRLVKEHFITDGTGLSLLEAGCGTGNFLNFFQPHFSTLTGMDLNEGMLQVASSKLNHHRNVTLIQGSLLEKLPFEENQFDVVIIVQVIHHLTSETGFDSLEHVMEELLRVVKPNGLLLINTCFPGQQLVSWYTDIIPTAHKRFGQRLISRYNLLEILYRKGFDPVEVVEQFDLFFDDKIWNNLDGPMFKEWRDLDSVWSLATKQELAQGLKWYSELTKEEKEHMFKEKERIREKIGYYSIIKAVKKLDEESKCSSTSN